MSKILDDFKSNVKLACSQKEVDYLRSVVWKELSTRWGYNQLRRHHTAISNVISKAERYAHPQVWKRISGRRIGKCFRGDEEVDCDQCKLYSGAWVRWGMKVDCKECT